MKDIQITLEAARVNAGYTQKEVSEILHVAKSTIINWEKGRVKPSFIVLNTLSGLYKMPIDNIILPQKST